MISRRKVIPSRWNAYTPIGKQVPGTVFIPFRIPLSEGICEKYLPKEQWFTPKHFMQQQPNVKMIINLTEFDDGHYYNFSDFTNSGVQVVHIKVKGKGLLPPEKLVDKFHFVVCHFISRNCNRENLIGVHCTHGINRTGYFICRFMKNHAGISGRDALKAFQEARGAKCKRQRLINRVLEK